MEASPTTMTLYSRLRLLMTHWVSTLSPYMQRGSV